MEKNWGDTPSATLIVTGQKNLVLKPVWISTRITGL